MQSSQEENIEHYENLPVVPYMHRYAKPYWWLQGTLYGKENLGERGNRIFADYGPDMPRDMRLDDGSPHSHNSGNLCGKKGLCVFEQDEDT